MSNLPMPRYLADLDYVGDRRGLREISRVRTASELVSIRERAKVDALADVTQSALVAVSHISSMEALLISRDPHAQDRLRFTADAGCAGIAHVVLDMGRHC